MAFWNDSGTISLQTQAAENKPPFQLELTYSFVLFVNLYMLVLSFSCKLVITRASTAGNVVIMAPFYAVSIA